MIPVVPDAQFPATATFITIPDILVSCQAHLVPPLALLFALSGLFFPLSVRLAEPRPDPRPLYSSASCLPSGLICHSRAIHSLAPLCIPRDRLANTRT